MEVDLEVDLEGESKGDFRGDFKHDMEGDLLSSSGKVRSRTGLVQVRSGLMHVWFRLQIKFNSLELDSEVGRLVWPKKGFFLGRRMAHELCNQRLPRIF